MPIHWTAYGILIQRIGERPWWATALSVFCAATVVFLVTRDIAFPEARDTEVWFGFEVRGRIAWLTAPLHWLIFGIGAWGFWSQRPWVWPWASIYAFYIAASHLVWNLTSPSGDGWVAGLWQLTLFAIPGALLLVARPSRPSSAPST